MHVETKTDVLSKVPFGRRRFFALVGSGFFGVAMRLAAPDVAKAWHGGDPYPCYGFYLCHCCSGSTCCESTCTWPANHSHCPSGTQCWYACYCTVYFRCCDWHTKDSGGSLRHCICKGVVGSCGPIC